MYLETGQDLVGTVEGKMQVNMLGGHNSALSAAFRAPVTLLALLLIIVLLAGHVRGAGG